MKLKYSTTFPPQTNRQTEWTNKILEDMLQYCALDFKGGWSKYLYLAELPIIIVIKQRLRWPLMRLYMDVVVDHLLHGMRQARKRFLSGTFRRKLS